MGVRRRAGRQNAGTAHRRHGDAALSWVQGVYGKRTEWSAHGLVKEEIMATKFEELVTGMVNIGFGAAAMTAEKGKEIVDGLNARGEQVLRDLNDRGEQARRDRGASDFTRSMSDIFEEAGGTFSEVTERLSDRGATAAERVLDELILARVRSLTKSERVAFMAHVRDLVDSVDDGTVTVEVEDAVVVEVDEDPVSDSEDTCM